MCEREREMIQNLPLIWNRAKQRCPWIASARPYWPWCQRFCWRNNPFFFICYNWKNEWFVVWVRGLTMNEGFCREKERQSQIEQGNKNRVFLRFLSSHPTRRSVVTRWVGLGFISLLSLIDIVIWGVTYTEAGYWVLSDFFFSSFRS